MCWVWLTDYPRRLLETQMIRQRLLRAEPAGYPSRDRHAIRAEGPTGRRRSPDDRSHGLDIVQALAGQDGWETRAANNTRGRLAWARLSW
jgi:hypothetical protein